MRLEQEDLLFEIDGLNVYNAQIFHMTQSLCKVTKNNELLLKEIISNKLRYENLLFYICQDLKKKEYSQWQKKNKC